MTDDGLLSHQGSEANGPTTGQGTLLVLITVKSFHFVGMKFHGLSTLDIFVDT